MNCLGLRSFRIAAVTVLLADLPVIGAYSSPRPALPAGVSADWWSQVQRSIQLEEYGIVGEATDGNRFRGANPANRFETGFDRSGMRLKPTEGSSWEWRLALTGWGRPGSLEAGSVAGLHAEQDRVELDRGPLTEWFVNTPEGLEHGFTVPVRPRAEGDRLVFDIAIAGGLRPVFAGDGQAIDFYSTGSISVLRYAKLVVTDASGSNVPARMEPIAGGVRIVVNDSDAIYPLIVDPLATSASWTAAGEGIDNRFGHSVSSAGDVNNDGYSDVIVGANHNSLNGVYAGKAYLYLGGPIGPSATPSWTKLGEAAGSEFGASVATAGDVNEDGYSDVVIGAPYYSSGTVGGKAYLYLGGASGLSATPAWTAVGQGADNAFGWAVATAGDVNGDGNSDVIIGAFGNASSTGKAYLYLGMTCPCGLSMNPSWTKVGEIAASRFGRAVATAGDVNGDGYSDVIIGASDYDIDPINALFFGKAYLYLGGPSGLPANPASTAVGQARDNYYGCSVGTAGDVNGDGYSDVVVGAYANNSGIGRAYVYLGRSAVDTTMLATASWSVAGNSLGTNTFGWSVGTAGDVNGDGFSDVVISSGISVAAGRAHVFVGGASGLATTPSWTTSGGDGYGQSVATAGDVNGDGYSDVLIGYDGSSSATGKAHVFMGGPSVAGIGFSSNKSTITWNGMCNPSLYDVVRGVISDLPNFTLATCLENNSTDASTPAGINPPAGAGYYYLASCDSPKNWNDGTQTGTRIITACP
jgi:hypothetical protein